MMREIKFRAWHKPTQTMVVPDSLESINFDTKVLGVYMHMDDRGFHKLRTSDFELMQFTGLRDKNGVEIYEGDIVALYGMFDEGTGPYHNATVQFQNGSFCIDDPFEYGVNRIPIAQWLEDGGEYVVVIGNIYEHPHLIELQTQTP